MRSMPDALIYEYMTCGGGSLKTGVKKHCSSLPVLQRSHETLFLSGRYLINDYPGLLRDRRCNHLSESLTEAKLTYKKKQKINKLISRS